MTRKALKNPPPGKPPTYYGARFYIERKYCVTGYSLNMLYGAAVLAPRKYDRPQTRVYLRVGQRLVPLWPPLLGLSRPFNRYTPGTWANQKGTK